jgi:membrane protease subunit (stomatin/prohibitin family)
MVGTLHLFNTDDIIEQFKALIVRKLSTCISKFILQRNVSVVQLGAFIDEISNVVRDAINEEFAQYGLKVTNFDVASINFDKKDPNVVKILDAQSEASKRRMEGYTYQQERQIDVMESAAGNEGSAGQILGAGMGMGMGVRMGGIFGQQMGSMASVMDPQTPAGQPVPPPPPVQQVFHILINNVQQQCDLPTVGQMIQSGQITRDTYVWKAGMAQWAKAGDVVELQTLFGAVPPPPPVV